MSIRMGEKRERLYEQLEDATGEKTRAGALDAAARYYTRMAGGPGVPTGALEELMQLAVQEGSVTPEQIADVLDAKELRVDYSREWGVRSPD